MKKELILSVTFLIILGLVLLIIFDTFVKRFEHDTQFFKESLGKTVVIQKDTLKIIDYSLFNETFTLSDGRKVSKDLIKILIE